MRTVVGGVVENTASVSGAEPRVRHDMETISETERVIVRLQQAMGEIERQYANAVTSGTPAWRIQTNVLRVVRSALAASAGYGIIVQGEFP